MPTSKPKVTALDADAARKYFAEFEGLEHLRFRVRADLLVIESGPNNDPIPHARLRRLTRLSRFCMMTPPRRLLQAKT